MSALSKAIGRRMRELRLAQGLTQTTVGAEIGVGKKMVCALETGRHLPRLPLIHSYAKVLGTTVQAVLAPVNFEALCAVPEGSEAHV